MWSIAKGKNIAVLFLALEVIVSVFASAQTAPAPPEPVPVQITAAKSVFIANAGADAGSLAYFKKAGEPNRPYNDLYAAVKNWGRYDLVSSPTDADLILQIRFIAPLTGCQTLDSVTPELEVTILDAKSHRVLWSLGAG